jgi:hypothetical protein
MAVEPDYSQQLDQIVNALNRPGLPTWVIAMLSATLGFLASVLSQLFQHRFAEVVSRTNMRRVIYPDLGSMYSNANHFLHLETTQTDREQWDRWRRTRLASFLRFEGERYAHENRATYLQLAEYPHLDNCYSALHSALADDEYGFDINCGLAVEIIEDCIRLGWIPAKYIKKYMGEEDAEALSPLRNKTHPQPSNPPAD